MSPLLRSALVVFAFAAWTGCSSAPPQGSCQSHLDCPTGQVCTDGQCAPPTVTPDCQAGDTRPCGPEPVGACRKGVQRCVDGKFETACTGAVQPTDETCNKLDDDCDGEVDEGAGSTWTVDADGDGFGSAGVGAQTKVACAPPAGFVGNASDCDDTSAAVHPDAPEVCEAAGVDEDCDGTVNEGCGCSTPGAMTPCCAGRGVQTCEAVDGGTALSACSVQPSDEVCNGLDDDCDGQVDETLFLPDAGPVALDGGVAEVDGGCTLGLGACAATGALSCANGALACGATPGTPSTEVCNGADDDCDGQVDEAGAGLCAASGQVCSAATCACPGSQSVCNGACVTLSAEVCDHVDNDCNGQVDEGLTIQCAADADGDGYADGAATTQQCPDTARPQAGNCPLGFVAPASSLGVDCDPMNGAHYRLVSSKSDADGDGLCAGSASNDCVGATPLPGRRFASACPLLPDCNDASAAVWQFVASRTDADGDTACVGTQGFDCVGTSALPGRRFAADCRAVDDCNDGDVGKFQLVSSRSDADNDGYCAGTAANDCVGMSPLAGRRFANNCLSPDDCNDTNGAVFRIASVRADADNDTYCAGVATNQCIGSSPPAGYRLAANCAGDDCRDSNPLATTACVLPGAYATASRGQTCPNGAQTTTLTVVNFCPFGFSLSGYSAQILSGAGNCSATSPTTIVQSCNFLEGTNCRIVGDCVAN